MKNISAFIFSDDGIIPNNALPIIVYHDVCDAVDKAQWLEDCFLSNNWTNNWRDLVLTHDHFHSNTHEVLGISKGKVKLMIGGQKNGKIFEVSEGDVLVLPAGVGHYSIPDDTPYEIVGGYPDGRSWDMMTGTIEERKSAFINIEAVPKPKTDPLYGAKGPLIQLWK